MNSLPFKVSVCISAFNSEKHLSKCLNSISKQTLAKELEIVLVDDGSKDSTFEIMLDFKQKHHSRIKLIQQKNKGLAQGRQTGIDHASGEYLAFLDTDDCFVDDALEKMYKSAISQKADIVECITSKDGQPVTSKYTGLQNSKSILRDYFNDGVIPPMLWMRIYRRELFETPVLPKIHTNNEDVFAFPCLLYKANSIYYLKEQLHYYSTENVDSVMNQLKNKSKGLENLENKLKTLRVSLHVQNYIGLKNIKRLYSSEFNHFQSRSVLDFCLGNYKNLSVNETVNIALGQTNFNLHDLNRSLSSLKHYNKTVQKLVNKLGLKKTVHVYRKLKSVKMLFTMLKKMISTHQNTGGIN